MFRGGGGRGREGEGNLTWSRTDRISAFTGAVQAAAGPRTPWKHQSTRPPLLKMVKKSSMAESGGSGPRPGEGRGEAEVTGSEAPGNQPDFLTHVRLFSNTTHHFRRKRPVGSGPGPMAKRRAMIGSEQTIETEARESV